jgi:hypothetical protein
MNARDVESEFESKRVPYAGGLLLFTAVDALALIRRAQATRIRVLGVDGLVVTRSETVSPLEHVADFSNSPTGNWREAEAFIAQRQALGLAFEVVLGETLAMNGRGDP